MIGFGDAYVVAATSERIDLVHAKTIGYAGAVAVSRVVWSSAIRVAHGTALGDGKGRRVRLG